MSTLPKYYTPKWFKGYELLPQSVYDRWGEGGIPYYMDIRVLITADQIRDLFGAPVTVNNWWWKRQQGISPVEWLQYRGYRPNSYYINDPFNGSQHRFGRALDCEIKGVKASEARDVIMNHQSRFPYIKRLEDNVDWVHFDVANIYHRGIHLFYP